MLFRKAGWGLITGLLLLNGCSVNVNPKETLPYLNQPMESSQDWVLCQVKDWRLAIFTGSGLGYYLTTYPEACEHNPKIPCWDNFCSAGNEDPLPQTFAEYQQNPVRFQGGHGLGDQHERVIDMLPRGTHYFIKTAYIPQFYSDASADADITITSGPHTGETYHFPTYYVNPAYLKQY